MNEHRVTHITRIAARATDPCAGMTLDEMTQFVSEAIRANIPGGTTVTPVMGWRGQIRSLEVAG